MIPCLKPVERAGFGERHVLLRAGHALEELHGAAPAALCGRLPVARAHGRERAAVEGRVVGYQEPVLDERRERRPDLFPVGRALELREVEALLFRRTWKLVVDGADERVVDETARAVAERDLDDLDLGTRADRLGVYDERAFVELVEFERRRVRLSGVVEHGGGLILTARPARGHARLSTSAPRVIAPTVAPRSKAAREVFGFALSSAG